VSAEGIRGFVCVPIRARHQAPSGYWGKSLTHLKLLASAGSPFAISRGTCGNGQSGRWNWLHPPIESATQSGLSAALTRCTILQARLLEVTSPCETALKRTASSDDGNLVGSRSSPKATTTGSARTWSLGCGAILRCTRDATAG